jgi:hypothetical protein
MSWIGSGGISVVPAGFSGHCLSTILLAQSTMCKVHMGCSNLMTFSCDKPRNAQKRMPKQALSSA